MRVADISKHATPMQAAVELTPALGDVRSAASYCDAGTLAPHTVEPDASDIPAIFVLFGR